MNKICFGAYYSADSEVRFTAGSWQEAAEMALGWAGEARGRLEALELIDPVDLQTSPDSHPS